MGTRSDIIAQLASGKWARIYCHFDGYLDHNGKILSESYTTQEKVDQLIGLGDLSVLGPEIGTKHNFDGDRPKNECNAYGRDRGESDVAAQHGDTLQSVWPGEDTWTEFTYVWTSKTEGGPRQWYVTGAHEGTQALVPLADALSGKAHVDADIFVPFLGVIGKHAY